MSLTISKTTPKGLKRHSRPPEREWPNSREPGRVSNTRSGPGAVEKGFRANALLRKSRLRSGFIRSERHLMKIAISAKEPNLDSEIYPRFGRSRYFILVDPETMQFEGLTNPNIDAPGGAGIGTAQLICNKGASAVITGTIGPKAHQALAAAGIRMLTGVSGPIRDAIANFKAGKLLGDPDAQVDTGSEGSAGMRGGAAMGRGMGMGGGSGRGGGMGRGMGRGMGCGGGRGTGMGPGRGVGPGRAAPRDWDADPRSGGINQPIGPDELSSLKQQANQLADELTRIRQRIEQMEKQ
jgi:predicted Fe-Mo cluster-binding NifX family protein